jgi:ABC-type branched-subunit amino acid transport system ATPase component
VTAAVSPGERPGTRADERAAGTPGTPLLSVQGVSKRYGGLLALDSVDLAVHPGEIVGLVGPNGSGKTTLLNLIGGSVPVTGGSIVFEGRDVTRESAHRRAHSGISRTFQVPRPLPSLTVVDNVAVAAMFGRQRRGRAEALEEAAGILERLGLSAHARAATSTLTLHERKFLEIARALALRPRLLLLDEVLGGLNPTEAAAGVEMIGALRDSGVSILYIEHNVKAVTTLADRMYVLNRGRNLSSGAPADVIADPAVVTAYLGSARARD